MPESRRSPSPAQPILAATSVLVGVLVAPDTPAVAVPETFARWRRLTPFATWMPIELGATDYAGILGSVAAALDRVGMTPRQLILLGEGAVARNMLELALRGELPCGGIVAIDFACGALPVPIIPTITAIRLVVHHGEEPRGNLIDALRAADLDARVINLDLAAGRGADTVARAAETFVLELVATIGRRTHDGVATP